MCFLGVLLLNHYLKSGWINAVELEVFLFLYIFVKVSVFKVHHREIIKLISKSGCRSTAKLHLIIRNRNYEEITVNRANPAQYTLLIWVFTCQT